MSEVFTVRPNTIERSSLLSVRASLSASDYRTIKTPVNSKKLLSLIKKHKQGCEIGSDAYMPKSQYRFLKTVNINDLVILDETKIEYCKPCKGAITPKAGSIFVAKDGGGQGLGECCVYEPQNGITDFISAGILSLEFKDTNERNYVLGILKSLHFKEFIDGKTPGGSTIRHSKLLSLEYDVPWSNDASKRLAITELVENMIHKERLIASKNKEIDQLITDELAAGLIAGAAKAQLPCRNDILKTTRLDAGIYTDLVRETNYLIENYKNGYYYIPDKFKANRGQNLQVTSIGESYYSETCKPGFYRIFTNVEMTDLRTITGFRWLGNKRSLTTLPKNCVMLAADGMIVGRSFFFDELPNTITNIHPWVITSKDKSQPRYKSVFLSLFLSYLKNIGYLEKIKDKSNGGGLKKNHIEKWIKIPCFPDKIQEKIADIYYKAATPPSAIVTITAHKKRNATLGIFQLNMEVLSLREQLAKMVNDIILNG
jgi:hypothetical protein